MKTHFAVPARELLHETPPACPVYPPLTFDGVAIDEHDRQYLILNTPAARCYAGPDAASIRRVAELLTKALRDGRANLDEDYAFVLVWWIETCWESLVDELVEQHASDVDHL